jgi:hypothetical protein
MIADIIYQICIGAICGAYTVLALMVAFYGLCAVCKAIVETLYPDYPDQLPR